LIKGLSEQPLGVTCMAGSNRVDHAAEPFDASRLVQLALTPLMHHLQPSQGAQTKMPAMSVLPVTSAAPARVPRPKKPMVAKASKSLTKPEKLLKEKVMDEDILIPTFTGDRPQTPARRSSAKAATVLKVAHG